MRKLLFTLLLGVCFSCLPISTWAQEQKPTSATQDQTQKSATEAPQTTAAEPARSSRVRLGGLAFGAGYSRNPFWYPYGYWWRSPLWYFDPYWAYWPPYFPPAYSLEYTLGKGEIRLKCSVDDAEVYLNGAYAGLAKDLKSMWLEPGAYDLSLKAERRSYHQRIYILSGKTLRIQATLSPAPGETKP